MATRSNIGYLKPDGSVSSIYCHNDGYLTGVGKVLFKHYDTLEKVEALISRGGASFIGPTLEESMFYTQRGERLHIIQHANQKEFADSFPGSEFDYQYFFVEGNWYYAVYNNLAMRVITQQALNDAHVTREARESLVNLLQPTPLPMSHLRRYTRKAANAFMLYTVYAQCCTVSFANAFHGRGVTSITLADTRKELWPSFEQIMEEHGFELRTEESANDEFAQMVIDGDIENQPVRSWDEFIKQYAPQGFCWYSRNDGGMYRTTDQTEEMLDTNVNLGDLSVCLVEVEVLEFDEEEYDSEDMQIPCHVEHKVRITAPFGIFTMGLEEFESSFVSEERPTQSVIGSIKPCYDENDNTPITFVFNK